MAMNTWEKNSEGCWTYETHVGGDFKAHIEKEFSCPIIVEVRGAGTKYAKGPGFNDTGESFEKNFYGGGECDVKFTCYRKTDKPAPTIDIIEF